MYDLQIDFVSVWMFGNPCRVYTPIEQCGICLW